MDTLRAAAGFPVTKERQIGPTLDFTSYAPDEEARTAGQPVARIVETPAPGVVPQGFSVRAVPARAGSSAPSPSPTRCGGG